jgi:hypothetical protein
MKLKRGRARTSILAKRQLKLGTFDMGAVPPRSRIAIIVIVEAFAVDGPAIVDCVVAADEMPNVPHIEPDLAANYAIARIKEAVIAVAGR